MKKIIIKPKIKISNSLDLKNLNLINKNLSLREINNIKILYNNKEKKLEDLFTITEQTIKSDVNEVLLLESNFFYDFLGFEWSNDLLLINSNVGSYLGAKMKSGKITVKGSCQNYMGAEMSGGAIVVKKNAGNFVGSSISGKRIGMTGGSILILGNVDKYLCYQMRRGFIFVGGEAGDNCCNNLVAGTIIIKKGVGKNFCIGMKRGTVILLSNVTMQSNFIESGNCSLAFINLLNQFVSNEFKMKIFGEKSKVSRFIGDKNIRGQGELLKII